MDGFLLCSLLIMCMVMKMAENAAPSLYSMNAHRVSVCESVCVCANPVSSARPRRVSGEGAAHLSGCKHNRATR